jgi:hypothetical protein
LVKDAEVRTRTCSTGAAGDEGMVSLCRIEKVGITRSSEFSYYKKIEALSKASPKVQGYINSLISNIESPSQFVEKPVELVERSEVQFPCELAILELV